MTEIPMKKAQWLKKHLQLEFYSSFSNPETSDLCHGYRMETGYSVPGIDAEFMRLVNTKDDAGMYINKAYLICEDPRNEDE